MRLESFPPPRRLFRTPLDCNGLDRLQGLKQDLPDSIFATFSTWRDVRDWLSAAGDWSADGDAVLRPILEAFKRAPDETWYHVLLCLFWPGLDRIARRLKLLGGDHVEELDSQIHWAFLHALHRLDLSQRPSRLGQKLLNDTQHDVRSVYTLECKLQGQFDRDEDREEEDEGILARQTYNDAEPIWTEFRIDRAWACARLRVLLRRGALSLVEYVVLVRCCLHGDSDWELAARQGLTYEAAKRRRQRALAALKKTAPDLSPESPDSPLSRVGPIRSRRSRDAR